MSPELAGPTQGLVARLRGQLHRPGTPDAPELVVGAFKPAVPVEVRVDAADRPAAVRLPGWPAARRVARQQDCWRIDDEWWRERPISRLYYALLLDDGALQTVYQDLVGGDWYAQQYGTARRAVRRWKRPRQPGRAARPEDAA